MTLITKSYSASNHDSLPTQETSQLTSSARFYPDCMPSFPHEPTQERFRIAFIGDGVGEGVMSLTHFMPQNVVFAFTGFFSAEITQFSLQINEGLHLHDPYFYGKILHSCNPNTYVDVERRLFIATKPIFPHDFVTMDYAQTEAYLFRTFPCSCGELNCRGVVKGNKQ